MYMSRAHRIIVLVILASCSTLVLFRQKTAVIQKKSSKGWSSIAFNDFDETNPLRTYFESYKDGPLIDKWLPYFGVYHRYFEKFRNLNRPIRFLEIGVQSGGTIQFWKHYFGPTLIYEGIDINFLCMLFENKPSVSITLGDQSNATFWAEYLADKEPYDIVIDDGGHSMVQQITTFEAVYSHVATGGIYLVEDVATSYDSAFGGGNGDTGSFGGGYGKTTTWAEYAKKQVDHVNGHYIRQDGFPSQQTLNTLSVGFYDQMVVFERGVHPLALPQKRGSIELPYSADKNDYTPTVLEGLKKQLAPYIYTSRTNMSLAHR